MRRTRRLTRNGMSVHEPKYHATNFGSIGMRCTPLWLKAFGCLVVWLFVCLFVWLVGCLVWLSSLTRDAVRARGVES